MDPKPTPLRNIVIRLFLFCLLALFVRFAYVITLRGESCDDITKFCLSKNNKNNNNNLVTSVPHSSSAALSSETSSPPRVKPPALWSTKPWKKTVRFYAKLFQDLIGENHISPISKSLCIETPFGEEVFALREIGIKNSMGVSKKPAKPLVVGLTAGSRLPFGNESFDFVFSAGSRLDLSPNQAALAADVARVLRPGGVFVAHTGPKDEYTFNSFIRLFDCCKFVASKEIEGSDPRIHQIVMKKYNHKVKKGGEKCLVPGYKRGLVRKAEPLLAEEPLKPWITLKKNIQNVKYLPSMADINFKNRYVYVDVGARSYGSSIGSWFKKQYPKQNKTFDVYAIEADKAFYEEYRSKKAVTLLPYAAWVKNETLFFEVNHDPSKEEEKAKGKGMGRIKSVRSDGGGVSSGVEIEGFDFADWLKRTVSEKDFVVMKMDVEGTEFDLIPRLFETGAICLIDEIFLECHYNRWQRCCPGVRSAKYQKTYGQCLDLFTSLRKSGVLVHQWW